jgi:hypothetical protein
MSTTVNIPPTPPVVPSQPRFAISNIWNSLGTTLTGGAAVLGVLSASMKQGMPTDEAGWLVWGAAVATGLAGVFHK